MRDRPLVSVIIVNWNGGEVFQRCLKSLARLKYPNWELILVDNGSSDGSQSWVEKYRLNSKRYQLIQNQSNVGFAKANNQGFEISRGEYILLLNNDTEVSPDFLKRLVTRLEKSAEIGVIQPRIFLMDQIPLLDSAGSFLTTTGFLQHWGFMQKDGPEYQKERWIFSAKGACMLIRRSVVETVGLFDSDFGSYFEETDFCWRVWLTGKKILFFPETSINHKLGMTSKRLNQFSVNYHSYKNRLMSLLINLARENLVRIYLKHLTILIGLGLYFGVTMQFAKTKMIFLAIWWNLINLPKTIVKRRRVQGFRKISDRVLFRTILVKVNIADMFGHFQKVEANFR